MLHVRCQCTHSKSILDYGDKAKFLGEHKMTLLEITAQRIACKIHADEGQISNDTADVYV